MARFDLRPKMKLAPERRQVVITFRVPEPIVVNVVAGTRSRAMHEKLDYWKVEVWDLPTKGRRNDLGRATAVAR